VPGLQEGLDVLRHQATRLGRIHHVQEEPKALSRVVLAAPPACRRKGLARGTANQHIHGHPSAPKLTDIQLMGSQPSSSSGPHSEGVPLHAYSLEPSSLGAEPKSACPGEQVEPDRLTIPPHIAEAKRVSHYRVLAFSR
jgi:hypothetical protein